MKKSVRLRLIDVRKKQGWSQRDVAAHLGTTQHNVSRWEQGITTPGQYFQAKLCTLFGKSAEELGLIEGNGVSPTPIEREASGEGHTSSSSTDALALWTVPYARNRHFTGREDLLEQLAECLSIGKAHEPPATRRVALTQQAIKGLGGIGKTQIAIEYAYRSREQGSYTHILWLNAASEEAIITSFLELAQLLPDFAAKEEKDQRKLVAAIKHWLAQCQQPWLLIFDNADDLSLLQQYLPQGGNGRVLLTTRANAVGALAEPLEVETMGVIEGTHFLLRRTQRQNASDEEINEASNVVMALDGFPLALDQAGAYIEETGCSFGDYLQLYHDHRKILLARRGRQTTNYPDSVATTWSLSFEKIEQANAAAAELLRLCAFLAPDHIPEELLRDGTPHWPPLLQQTVTDPLTFNQMLEQLLAFSLVKRLTEDRMLSLHRLVQAVQMDRMEAGEQRQWAERVVHAVNALFPRDPKEQIETWPQCLRYLEQVQACDQLVQQYRLQLPEAADLLDRAGIYLREHASYSLAEPLFQRALLIAEQQLGPEHLQVASSLHNLGILYHDQGKYEQAELLLQRALHIREHALGPEHPQLAYPLNNLGNLYREQGKCALAEPLLQRALHIWEQALGPEHPRLAYPLTNLGILYYEQGHYEQAEPLLQRALHIQEHALGPEHPRLAYPLTNLGNLYYEQGHYEQAEPLYQRALHIREQALGQEHPQVAYPLTSLGELYLEQGHYEQAEPLYQRALHIWEQALGQEHPLLAYPLNGLGNLYLEQGKYERAELVLQRALHIWEQALGSQHSEVAHPLTNLGNLYYEQGHYERAEPLLQRALHIWEHALGPEHSLLAYPLNGLANISRDQGQYQQAEALYQRALILRQQHLSPQHPDIAETLLDLARLRQMQQQLTEALSLYQQALAIRQHILGPHHPKTIQTHESLSNVLHQISMKEQEEQNMYEK